MTQALLAHHGHDEPRRAATTPKCMSLGTTVATVDETQLQDVVQSPSDSYVRSVSGGNSASDRNSRKTAIQLEAAMEEYETRIAALEEEAENLWRLPLHERVAAAERVRRPSVEFGGLGDDLGRLAADALEAASGRSTPGAMDVFGLANSAMERLAGVMEIVDESLQAWSETRAVFLCHDGEEDMFREKVHFLDAGTVNAVSTAVQMLNDVQLQAPPDGLCAVHSAARRGFYVLYRSEKDEPRAKALASRLPKTWTAEQSFKLSDGEQNQVKILDGVTSVLTAAEQLNAGELTCENGLCAVYSARNEAYYLLYRTDMVSTAFRRFQRRASQ